MFVLDKLLWAESGHLVSGPGSPWGGARPGPPTSPCLRATGHLCKAPPYGTAPRPGSLPSRWGEAREPAQVGTTTILPTSCLCCSCCVLTLEGAWRVSTGMGTVSLGRKQEWGLGWTCPHPMPLAQGAALLPAINFLRPTHLFPTFWKPLSCPGEVGQETKAQMHQGSELVPGPQPGIQLQGAGVQWGHQGAEWTLAGQPSAPPAFSCTWADTHEHSCPGL